MIRRPSCLTVLFALIVLSTGTVAENISPGDVRIENLTISKPLTDQPGNAVEGREVFADRSLGNCLACHANTDLKDQLFHGEVGPSLDGVAGRWSSEQLRTIVVNAKKVFTDLSVMPAFYSLEVGKNVREDLVGEPILTAQQVEDLVAYLSTLE